MASFGYLWQNRAKFKFMSGGWLKAWVKRILTLTELIKRNRFRNQLIKSGASIASTAEIGNASIDGNKNNLRVGSNSFIGKVEIALHEKVEIGNNVCINDGVKLLTASHNVSDPEWKHIKSPIIIDDYVWIATNAIILPGVHIARGAVVGAGAVVTKNIMAGEIVVGNPAKVVTGKNRELDFQYNPCTFLAANNAWIKG